MRRVAEEPDFGSARVRSKPKPSGRAPRARVAPAWRRRAIRYGLATLAMTLVAGGGFWLWRTGMAQQFATEARLELNRISAGMGIRLQDIRVTGRVRTQPDHILAALHIRRGESLLGLDVPRTKERLEALPWIKSAVVERRLPDMLRLTIVERVPVALWQREGRFVLLDGEGREIADDIEPYRALPVVVGERAPEQLGALLALLHSQPSLEPRIKAAVLVAGRRWNLRLDGVDRGIDVRLPEEEPAGALARLVEFDRRHGLLKRRLAMVDMRLPDRLVVRMEGADEPEQTMPPLGTGPGRDA